MPGKISSLYLIVSDLRLHDWLSEELVPTGQKVIAQDEILGNRASYAPTLKGWNVGNLEFSNH
jgi:hypothetical protein